MSELLFEPGMVEEVVRRELSGRPAQDPLFAEYRRRLDMTYALEPSGRGPAARALHLDFFRRLEWVDFFNALLAPLLPRVAAAGVRGAEQDEGCFINSELRFQVRIQLDRFRDRTRLHRWLSHERCHVEDILDPAFGYREEPLDEPTRQRFAKFWCDSIDHRLGGTSIEPVTHASLVQRARSAGQPRCTLCKLPAGVWPQLTPRQIEHLRTCYPQWEVEKGACERCAEWADMTVLSH